MLRWLSIGRDQHQCRGSLLAVQGVPLLEFLEDSDFNLARIPVLGDCTDDLYGNPLICLSINSLYDLAECSLAQESHGPI